MHKLSSGEKAIDNAIKLGLMAFGIVVAILVGVQFTAPQPHASLFHLLPATSQ
jgi:hypothetical protein